MSEAEIRSEKCPFCAMPVEDDGPVCRQCGFEFGTQWQAPAGEEEAPFEAGLRTCSTCGVRNPVGRDFCAECNAPVGDYTSVKPFERIWSIGFLYRRGGETRPGLPGAARAGRACLGILLLANPVIVLGILFMAGKDNFFGFLRSDGLPEPEFAVMALMFIPMAAMGYLGLRLLGVRFGRPKKLPDAPRPLRAHATSKEPPEINEDE